MAEAGTTMQVLHALLELIPYAPTKWSYNSGIRKLAHPPPVQVHVVFKTSVFRIRPHPDKIVHVMHLSVASRCAVQVRDSNPKFGDVSGISQVYFTSCLRL